MKKRIYASVKEKSHAWYLKNKDKCRKKTKDWYWRCHDKALALAKRYRDKHPERIKARLAAFREKSKKRRDEYLAKVKSLPCVDCGKQYHPICMDFDHREPSKKTDSISKMGWCNVSLKRIKEEITKCDLVCSNCHRLRTYKMFGGIAYGR